MAKDKENTTPKKSGKSDKAEKKKPGKIAKWFKDLKSEFKKVVWPSKKTVVDNTAIVLAVVIFSAVIIGLMDAGFLKLMELVYNH
ncbi:MAG: preprotein translocase subunit SecE [Ruminococcus sp.]